MGKALLRNNDVLFLLFNISVVFFISKVNGIQSLPFNLSEDDLKVNGSATVNVGKVEVVFRRLTSLCKSLLKRLELNLFALRVSIKSISVINANLLNIEIGITFDRNPFVIRFRETLVSYGEFTF